ANTLPAGKLIHGALGLWVMLHGGRNEVGRSRPLLVELLVSLLHFLFLALQNREPVAVLPFDGIQGVGKAVNRLLESGHGPQAIGLTILRWRRPRIRRCRAALLGSPTADIELQPVEHTPPWLLGLLRLIRVQLRTFLGGAVLLRPL